MSSDFLTRIQEAEAKAKQAIEKAAAKISKDNIAYEAKLKETHAQKLSEYKEKLQKGLKEKQKKAKQAYQTEVEKGIAEADKLRKDGEAKIEKILPMAETYFLNDLLS